MAMTEMLPLTEPSATKSVYEYINTTNGRIDLPFKPKKFTIFLHTTQYTEKCRTCVYDEDLSTTQFYKNTEVNPTRTAVDFNSTTEMNTPSQVNGVWGININYASTWTDVWYMAVG